jgi:hypothetical protein
MHVIQMQMQRNVLLTLTERVQENTEIGTEK